MLDPSPESSARSTSAPKEEVLEEFVTSSTRNEKINRFIRQDNPDEILDKTYTENYINKVQQRKEFAEQFVSITRCWLFFLGSVIILNGFGLFGFRLSDAVIIALLTTSLANVLGLALQVANYLFRKEGRP